MIMSFYLFIIVKTSTKLNLDHSDKFETEILKNSSPGSRSPDNTEFGHNFQIVVLRRTAQKYTKHYNARAQPLLYSLNLMFSDFLVVVVVVVFNSLF